MNMKRILTILLAVSAALTLGGCGSNPEITVPGQRNISMRIRTTNPIPVAKSQSIRVTGGTPDHCDYAANALTNPVLRRPITCNLIPVDDADSDFEVPCLGCGPVEADTDGNCAVITVSGAAYNIELLQVSGNSLSGEPVVCAEVEFGTSGPTTIGIDTDADLDDDFDLGDLNSDGTNCTPTNNPEEFYDSDGDGEFDDVDTDDFGDGVDDGTEGDCDADGAGDDSDANDCGGSCGTPCSDGKGCTDDNTDEFLDCDSGVCNSNGFCEEATCTDFVINGDETDIDCGGADGEDPDCDACADTKSCVEGTDCTSLVCDDTVPANPVCVAPTCDDGVKNGLETGTDCGAAAPLLCGLCPEAETCDTGADCLGSICTSGICVATCTDAAQNGDETDVDCGGSCGATCDNTEKCVNDGDCTSDNCDVTTTPTAPVCAA